MKAVLIILGVGVAVLLAVVLLRRSTQADTVVQQAPSNKWDFFSDITTVAASAFLGPQLASAQGGSSTNQNKANVLASNPTSGSVLYV